MKEGEPSRKRAFVEDDNESKDSSGQKRIRFPKGKKAKTGDHVLDEQNGEVLPGWRNPRLAATERAVARNQLTADLLEEENVEMLNDVTRAEIRYEDNETFVDDGVQMEPFNLSKEREEGYFDAEGNYVEYINEKEIKDAWLDSIDARRDFAPINSNKQDNRADAPELSSGNVAEIKRRIADALEPGETVLRALKRLKGTSNRKEKMSKETKEKFDQLTEDASHLLENGDYNVYDEKQETFQREAEGYEKLAEARRQFTSTNSGPSVLQASAEDSYDMFADEDESTDINPVSDRKDPVSSSASQASESGYLQNDFVYDEASGYYYSSSQGYYYDPSTGLYCYAATGQWFSYNAESGAYEECQPQAVDAINS